MAAQKLVVLACLMAGMQITSAGCAGEIFICNGDKNPCNNKQCGAGMVCRVDNCKGCFAKCEPPGMVHIMSMPSGPEPMSSSSGSTGSKGSGPASSNGKVTSEAGPAAPVCPCPRILSPVCGAGEHQTLQPCFCFSVSQRSRWQMGAVVSGFPAHPHCGMLGQAFVRTRSVMCPMCTWFHACCLLQMATSTTISAWQSVPRPQQQGSQTLVATAPRQLLQLPRLRAAPWQMAPPAAAPGTTSPFAVQVRVYHCSA